MLSSMEGSYQGFDIDCISDITGISMSKVDIVEQGSQHSGSFGSDNTDALLNASYQDFDGEESLLESVSQVGVNTWYNSPKNRTASHQEKKVGHLETNEATYVHAGMSDVSSVQNGMSSALSTRPDGNNVNRNQVKKSEMFSSDCDIAVSGRQSVIKHHSTAPCVNTDPQEKGYSVHFPASSNMASIKDGKQIIGQKGEHHLWGQKGLIKDNDEYLRDMDDHHGLLRDNVNVRHGYDRPLQKTVRDVNGQNVGTVRDSTGTTRDSTGTVRDNHDEIREEVPQNSDHLQDSLTEQSQADGMLLGVKHDPETNELYDDKVREGADLLSKLLGGDHNASFTSYSSRGSDKNEKTRSNSFIEKANLHKQRSLDSSILSEPRQLHSSSPKKNSGQTGSLKSGSSHDDHVPLRHHRSLDSLKTETKFQESFSPEHHALSLRDNMKVKDVSSKEIQNEYNKSFSPISDLPGGVSHLSEEIRINNEYAFPENDKHVFPSGNAREQDINLAPKEDKDFRQLEWDIEEILSKKKLATYELEILEESIQRNKADMKSSESLVEQYRWQATQARSELMDLEDKRSQLQEECIRLEGAQKILKQKETFNNEKETFGQSKDELFRVVQEREQLRQDLGSMKETLKREQKKTKMTQDDLREKIRSLEGTLSKEHQENVKNLQLMKEQMYKERKKLRIKHQDKFNVENEIHDQLKAKLHKQNETLNSRLLLERKSHVEILEEKLKRETNQWKRTAENAELRIKQVEESLLERNGELDKTRKQLREEKQKNLDIEKHWRAQLESERQDSDIKHDGQERSWRDREAKLLQQQRDLENLVEERTTDFRRSEERCRSQTEELQRIIENKNEELKMLRGLMRQQEDATRVLGERLRKEAKEHVRNAVEKERQSLEQEKERVKRVTDDENEKHERIVKQMTEQLDIEKERHSQTKDILNKLKQESDSLRKQLVEVHGARITSVQKAKHENDKELEKIKDKLHEFTVQADKLEKIDQETAKAIYEECRRIAEMVDMPLAYKTPTRFSDKKSEEATGESPTKEALVSLRRCNDDLRQRLSDMKKQIAKQATQTTRTNETTSSEIADLRKRVIGKEEEIQRLQKKHKEEIERLKDEKKKEQLSYRRTISKLEQEFQKLVATKAASSPYKTKRDISRSAVPTLSNGVTHPQSPNVNSTPQKSSSADLLKHLQDRVKKLRAENENLKNSSDKESLTRSSRHSEAALSQSKGLTISQLRTPTKAHGSMSENIEQVARIQKLLASSTKDD